MIVYDLQCGDGHRFEGWFGSADEFQAQCARGLLTCPNCGVTDVVRVPSAARINTGVSIQAQQAPQSHEMARESASGLPVEGTEGRDPIAIAQMLYSRFVDTLLTQTEDVGKDFPAEARRIHSDQAPKRGIRGQATQEEHDALVDEGIPVARLPIPSDGHWN